MSDSQDRRTEVALFRYTLILPLIRGEYPPGGKDKLRQQIASRHCDIPYSSRRSVSSSTLARWERIYQERGFDGLKPQPRSDRGSCRAISPQTLDRAETLKREQPLRSARSIIRILSLDTTNPILEPRLAPRTLRRQLSRRGATAAQLLAEQRPSPTVVSSVPTLAICGKVTPCTAPISPTLPIQIASARSFCSPFSTITLA